MTSAEKVSGTGAVKIGQGRLGSKNKCLFIYFLLLCVFVQVSVVVGWGECVCVSGEGACWSVARYINWNFLHFWPHMLAKPRRVITL